MAVTHGWDYLIVTASNDAQAEAYREQLAVRERLGLLAGVRNVLVLPDPAANASAAAAAHSTAFSPCSRLNRPPARPTTGGTSSPARGP